MNTAAVRSDQPGWVGVPFASARAPIANLSGTPAGGGAYYFAKKSINADRASRFEAEMKRKAQLAAMEAEHRRQAAVNEPVPTPSENPSLKRANMARYQSAADDVASPSTEASHDPAPTRHEPETEAERVLEKGKYEAAQPFRPPKGNRLG
ncbi:hypothetical protein ATEIFO6365_0012012300 [Aspergillus terreus]|uniref:Uncharacterized protein n=1 Tax=Aspergillus terreus TaxID=33178 RepID=A0A5M3ZEM3_ASPTE|nr:hypothetical protein ATETN484_0013013300 [Aspergillus terreus]GFF20367.1 hypothetical protein ATEIFO6365_0012012300 [Aspergillus terreus]